MKIEQPILGAAASLDRTALSRRWLAAAVALGAGFLILVAVFFPVVSGMAGTWYVSSTYNHGFLILPIAIYMAWHRWPQILAHAPRPTLLAIPFMLAAGLLWYLGEIVSVEFVKQVAFVAMVQILVVSIIGWRLALILAVPILYLFFAVPFGEFLIEPLQDLTAVFVVKGLRLVGVPVYLDGVFISIPTGNFLVAEACAGLRYLIAMLALAVLFADITYRSRWRKLAFLAFAIVVPIIANGFRAFGIVMLAYLTNNKIAIGVDHIIYGWVFFALVTILVLVIGTWFRDHDPRQAPAPQPARPAPPVSTPRIALALGAALAAAVVAPGHATLARPAPGPRDAAVAVPMARGWEALPAYAGAWAPRYFGADATVLASYARGQDRVHVAIGYYAVQRDGAEVVSYETQLLPDDNWTRAAGGTVEASLDGGMAVVAYTRAVNRNAGRIIWHWYWVDGMFTANPLVAKLRQARAAIFGGSQAAAIVAMAADYRDQPGEAHAKLAAFVESLEPLAPLLAEAERP